MKRRIIIIGAGPGGLAAAMLLARFDAEVTVLERQTSVGGRSASIQREGFTFDTGPTFFLYPQVLEEIFASCGFDLHREIELIRLDPQYRLIFEGGGRIDATSDPTRMMQQIAAIAPGDAASFPTFMAENRAKFEVFRPVFGRAFESMRDLLAPEILRALKLLRPTQSVDADLSRHFQDHRVRLAFSFQSKYLGMSPFRCPSLFTILPFLEYEHGVYHPRGGCGAVMTVMAKLARRMGVHIHLGEPVREIEISGRRATGVRTDVARYEADAVVINADFAHAMTSLVPDRVRRRWRDRKLIRKKYSCSTFMLYLGIDGEIDLPHHTIFLTDEYRQNVSEIEGGVLTDNPSLYVQNASVTDATLAPPGCSTLYVLVPVPHRTDRVDWSDLPSYRARVMRQLGKLGIPNLERRIRVERIVTPHDWEASGIYRGATFNLRHSFDQMLHLRPRNRFEDLNGVYLVGGGTHPGSGLPVIFESARISTRLLAEDFELALRPLLKEFAPAPAVMEAI